MAEPTALVEFGNPSTAHPNIRPMTILCSEGDYVIFASQRTDSTDAVDGARWIRDHLDQHKPGRAMDIAVDWEVSACCNVCEDEIGDVETDDGETLRCRECGTTWNIDGTNGEREEGNDAE